MRKADYARSLARTREMEYRAARSPFSRAVKRLTVPLPVPKSAAAGGAFRSQALALGAAFLVVVSGAALAQAAALPQLADSASALAAETASGFSIAFGGISGSLASKVDTASLALRADRGIISAPLASAPAHLLAQLDTAITLSPMRVALDETASASNAAPAFSAPAPATAPPATLGQMQASAFNALAFLASPARIGDALLGEYRSLGTAGYDATEAALGAYLGLMKNAGSSTLALAAGARDTLAAAPNAVARMNLALGESVIAAAHFAVGADTAVAYGLAAAAPASAHAVVALAGSLGAGLESGATDAPPLAFAAFSAGVGLPARAAPAIARIGWGAEYGAAQGFVALTQDLSGRYLALVDGTGGLAYESAAGAGGIARSAGPLIARAPRALEDAYLGAAGAGALALNALSAQLSSVPYARSLAAAVAASPALSAGEQVALGIYETIDGFFNSTGRALAFLLGPPPAIVIPPSSVPVTAPAATTTPSSTAPTHVAVATYPTYTTLVQGLSQDALNQALAAQRSDILTTVAGMIQPVAAQTATNVTTIQEVNMIQDLTDLTVHNGTFLGGTFNGGTITNVSSIAAGSGTFNSITASTTNILGGFTVGATSPFLYVDGTTGRVGIGTSTPAVAVDIYATDAMRIPVGTTTQRPSPGDVGYIRYNTTTHQFEGFGDAGVWQSIGSGGGNNFKNTANTASGTAGDDNYIRFVTSNLERLTISDQGLVGIGTTSPYAFLSISNAATTPANTPLLAIASTTGGTSTSTLFTILANGNVGIGTTSPFALLSVNGSGYFPSSLAATNLTATGTLTITGLASFGNASTSQLTVLNDDFGATATSTFTSRGLFGIGTTSPYANLSIENDYGSNNTTLFSISSSTVANGSTASTFLAVLNNGNVGIGTTSPMRSSRSAPARTSASDSLRRARPSPPRAVSISPPAASR